MFVRCLLSVSSVDRRTSGVGAGVWSRSWGMGEGHQVLLSASSLVYEKS